VTGYYVLWAQPASTVVAEAFPVGLIAGTFLVVRRRFRPALLVLLTLASTGLYLAHGREPVVALGWGLAACLGALVVAEGVTAGGPPCSPWTTCAISAPRRWAARWSPPPSAHPSASGPGSTTGGSSWSPSRCRRWPPIWCCCRTSWAVPGSRGWRG